MWADRGVSGDGAADCRDPAAVSPDAEITVSCGVSDQVGEFGCGGCDASEIQLKSLGNNWRIKIKNRKFISFGVFQLDSDDIERLGKKEFSHISAILYGYNELNFHMKILIGARPKLEARDDLYRIESLHFFIASRSLMTKVFEFVGLVEQYRKIWIGSKDARLKKFDSIISHLDVLLNSPYYHLVEHLRNKVSAHYVFQEVMDSFDEASLRSDKSIWLCNQVGNSFYPIGEEFGFVSVLHKAAKELGIEIDDDILNRLFGWCDEALNFANKFSQALVMESYERFFPDKRLRHRYYFLEEGCMADTDSFRIPLFLRDDD